MPLDAGVGPWRLTVTSLAVPVPVPALVGGVRGQRGAAAAGVLAVPHGGGPDLGRGVPGPGEPLPGELHAGRGPAGGQPRRAPAAPAAGKAASAAAGRGARVGALPARQGR